LEIHEVASDDVTSASSKIAELRAGNQMELDRCANDEANPAGMALSDVDFIPNPDRHSRRVQRLVMRC